MTNPAIVIGQQGRVLKNQRVDIFVNGTTGNDANDGLTLATAVQTAERAGAIASGVCAAEVEYVVINLRGTITITSSFQFAFKAMRPSGTIVILDGGTDVTVVLDDGAGAPIVSDINAAGQIGLVGSGWTEKQYRGYWCELTGGPLDGTRHIIRDNTADTLTLLETGADGLTGGPLPDPGVGTGFRIIRPATEITAGAFSFREFGVNYEGKGQVILQNLYMSGGAMFGHQGSDDHYIVVSHFIHAGGGTVLYPATLGRGGDHLVFIADNIWDTSAPLPTFGQERLGYSQVENSIAPFIYLNASRSMYVRYSLIPALLVANCDRVRIFGSSIEAVFANNCKAGAFGSEEFGSHTAGLSTPDVPGVPTRFGGYRATGVPGTPVYPAVTGRDGANLSFNKSILADSTWGLELWNANAVIREISGTANSVGGAYVHAKSALGIYPGSAPSTLTGGAAPVIELSEDGATEVSTWAALAAVPISTPDCSADYTWPVEDAPPWDG